MSDIKIPPSTGTKLTIEEPPEEPPSPGTSAPAPPPQDPAPSRVDRDLVEAALDKRSPVPPLPRLDRQRGEVPGGASGQRPLSISRNARKLLRLVKRLPAQLCSVMEIGWVETKGGDKLSFSAQDRIDVLTHLIATRPDLSLLELTPEGDTIVTAVLLNDALSVSDQVQLIDHLAAIGVDLNQVDGEGEPPLETAMRLPVLDPILINALKESGAAFAPAINYPIVAMLTGFGGSVRGATGDKEEEIFLEGLSAEHALVELDPVVRHGMKQALATTEGPLRRALGKALVAWEHPGSCESFLTRLKAHKGDESEGGKGPCIFLTHWNDESSGHAIGFVLNKERGGVYLYACNTGGHKERHRCVIKYRIENFDKTIAFFKACEKDPDVVKKMFLEKVETKGLLRCDNAEQLPEALDKSSQKRGNCSVTSRKASLLAALWSGTRGEGVEAGQVKIAYKKVTTTLRQVGARRAMAYQHPELMGKTLVAMLTKFDRPYCQTLAFQLALAILRGVPTPPETPVPPSSSPEYLATVREALGQSHQDLQRLEGPRGATLAEHAQSKGNLKAFNILTQLASQKDTAS